MHDRETPRQPPPPEALYAAYNQRMVQDRGAENIKWRNIYAANGLTQKRGICFHHSAVKGGYGTRNDRVEYWTERPLSFTPSVPQPNGVSVVSAWPVRPVDGLGEGDEAHDRWVQAMAIADRYRGHVSAEFNRGVSYHAIVHPNRVLYYNLPLSWVSFHGDGANEGFVGFAWDGNSNPSEGEPDTFDPVQMRANIEHVIETGRGEGHFGGGLEFTMHSCWTNKPHDPGRVFAQFLVDIAPELGATIDMDFKVGNGQSFNDTLASGGSGAPL